MKPGRNDECNCGSGLKYKKCCGLNDDAERSANRLKDDADRNANRLYREMEASLMEQMLPFAEATFGDDSINEALQLFLDDEETVEFEDQDPLNSLFLPWFLFNWYLEDDSGIDAPTNQTIAEAFLEARGETLPAESVALLKACNRRPFSLFEVVDSVAGRKLTILDLLRDQTIEIDEDSASTSLKKGDVIVAALMAPFEGRTRALAIGPFALKNREKNEIVLLREEILEQTGAEAFSEELLHEQEAFVIGFYLDVVDEMLDEMEEEEIRR